MAEVGFKIMGLAQKLDRNGIFALIESGQERSRN